MRTSSTNLKLILNGWDNGSETAFYGEHADEVSRVLNEPVQELSPTRWVVVLKNDNEWRWRPKLVAAGYALCIREA